MNTSKIQTLMFGALLSAGALLAPSLRAQAEDAGAPPPPPAAGSERPGQGGPGGQVRGGDRMIQQLREHLKLTDEQVEKLKPILQAQAEEMRALRQEAQGADRSGLREKAQAIRAKYKGQIEAILTEEQKELFAQMQQRGPRGENRGEGGPGAGQGAGGPPPPPPAE